MKDGDFKLEIRSESSAAPAPAPQVVSMSPPAYVQPAAMPGMAPPAAPPPAAQPAAAKTDGDAGGGEQAEDEAKLTPIKSPMVGTFYRAASPDKPPFVKVGDVVSPGNTVCVIEAMKLFNEIESELAGRIVKVLVEDQQPVEYDQVLFLVEPG